MVEAAFKDDLGARFTLQKITGELSKYIWFYLKNKHLVEGCTKKWKSVVIFVHLILINSGPWKWLILHFDVKAKTEILQIK